MQGPERPPAWPLATATDPGSTGSPKRTACWLSAAAGPDDNGATTVPADIEPGRDLTWRLVDFDRCHLIHTQVLVDSRIVPAPGLRGRRRHRSVAGREAKSRRIPADCCAVKVNLGSVYPDRHDATGLAP